VLVLLVGLGVPGALAAVRDEAPTLSLDCAVVGAQWKEGWLRPEAAVRFTGNVTAPSTLTAFLRPVGRDIVTARLADFSVAQAGRFSGTLRLPPRALPGPYRLRILSTSSPPRPKPVDCPVEIPAPPEGVIDRALVGTSLKGPWLRYVGNTGPAVRGAHKTLWVRFRFLYPPTGKRIQIVWKLRWHIVVGKVYRRYQNTLDTVASSGAPLPKGVWLVVLTIDGRIAKKMDVRLQ
jgi:hypothetical protein